MILRFDEKTLTGKIIQKLNLDNFQLGKTKIFLRAGQIAQLDSRRSEILGSAARLIQGQFQAFVARKEFTETRMATIALQAYFRGFLARSIYTFKRRNAGAILIQKHTRRWLTRSAFLRINSAVLVIQSSIRCFATQRKFICKKEHKAAFMIQPRWRTWKFCMFFRDSRNAAVSIQCAWRRRLAKRELQKLKLAANEAGSLREAKNKLEKTLEDLNIRLTLEKRLRVATEESKALEVSKCHRAFELLSAELDEAKLTIITENEKNCSLASQLELSIREKTNLQERLIEMEHLRKENLYLKKSLESLTKTNSEIEEELLKARKCSHETSDKLQDVEANYLQLQQNLQNLEEKLSNLEDENHILGQKALSLSPFNTLSCITRPYFENHYVASVLPAINQKAESGTPSPKKSINWGTSPTKSIIHSHSFSDFRRPRVIIERHEEYQELLAKCIKEDFGFNDDKPVAACIMYKCLLHWHAFESERTAIFDYIIETINSILKADNENDILPYWLCNASTLLCLLQRNLRSQGLLTTPCRHPARSLGLNGSMAQGIKYSSQDFGPDEMSHVDARYPAMLFKQQLTACLEKIFGLIRDNLKKEISPLLSLCIQAPKSSRGSSGRASKSSECVTQQILSNHWDRIIKFLDSLMARLHKNHVPSFFIRKLITQVFSFINIQLFNSLLLRRECCTLSNGEYVKSGLAVLEKWIADATEEFAGSSWDELNYIRQAVGFLVIHDKRRKSLEEIRHDLCPALSVRQIYRICTMYWDDKYSTQSVSNEVVATMREIVNNDSQNLVSNSFLLDDDLSIPFSLEDISKAIPVIDPSDVELPTSLRQIPSAMFLVQHPGLQKKT